MVISWFKGNSCIGDKQDRPKVFLIIKCCWIIMDSFLFKGLHRILIQQAAIYILIWCILCASEKKYEFSKRKHTQKKAIFTFIWFDLRMKRVIHTKKLCFDYIYNGLKSNFKAKNIWWNTNFILRKKKVDL